ncbi:MAG: MFS transporter [Luteolibacter sp.]|jgi:maltose/moltooligosaccharide transporter|nr:MFS transporter [Luteolibacter sp.]
MNEKPRLSFWQIWNMSFGFLGIQFGWGLQMANMSSIYQFLGADEKDIPILWLAAPLTGLIVQPIIGYYSDRTWTRLGRRRPYFLTGAILASLALIAMPNSPSLWVAAGLLWILDASVNISMEPFRAFVGDMLPKAQRKSGFAMQSLLIGLGAVLSSALPFILTNGFGVSKEATVDSPIPPAVKLAFYIGAGVFIAAVMVTILSTREYPPDDMAEFEAMKREKSGVGHAFREIFQGIGSMPTAMKQLSVVQFFTWLALFCMWIYFVPAVGKGVFGGVPLGLHDEESKERIEKETRWLAPAAALAKAYEAKKSALADEAKAALAPKPWYGAMLQMFGLSPADPDAGERIDAPILEGLIREAAVSTKAPSENERESPLVQSFALALATHQVDSAEATGIAVAAGSLRDTLASARRYQEGTAWGGVCFSTYNLVAFGFSFVLLALTRFMAARRIHMICLAVGAAGLASAFLVKQPALLLLSMVGVGVAWASILSMPYAMLANVIPGNKMGFYMGVFNFFIVLPQILAAVALGKLVDSLLGGDAMKAVLAGGLSMAIASVATLIVGDESETGNSSQP